MGRIVAVVDFFDALSMARCYRAAFPAEDVRAMLLDGRAQFLSLRDRVTESRVSFGDLVHASEHDWDLK